jgi:putative aminopeptidase FrvX
MNLRRFGSPLLAAVLTSATFSLLSLAQSSTDPLLITPAVSGYEQQLAARISSTLKDLSPKTDNLGNVYVTLGAGSPHRLIVTPMDEPGYIVSEITPDGFLRVQRLPQRAPNAVFDLLHAAQPVTVVTRGGKQVAGVFTGLSVHLQPARVNPPSMANLDEMYVDIGAASAEEVRAAGVDLLDPVSLTRAPQQLASTEMAAPSIGDRIGCIVLVNLLSALKQDSQKFSGTLTVAFAVQQWTGGRGLDRLLNELHPDEMVYVGRLFPPKGDDSKAPAAPPVQPLKPGAGILLASSPTGELGKLAAELKKVADEHQLKLSTVAAAPPAMAGYAKPTLLPERFAHLGTASLYPVTPAETISETDIGLLEALLYHYVSGADLKTGIAGSIMTGMSDASLIQSLTETYGASGHEEKVREEVKRLLPQWAKPETDAAGNLVLKLGNAASNSKAPRIVFVAHMDEIGYQVRSIEPDGRLLVDVLGGGYTEYFLGHVVLVQKSDGTAVSGILELPEKWDQPGFEWPKALRPWTTPCISTSAPIPRKKPKSSESKSAIGPPYRKNIARSSAPALTPGVSTTV